MTFEQWLAREYTPHKPDFAKECAVAKQQRLDYFKNAKGWMPAYLVGIGDQSFIANEDHVFEGWCRDNVKGRWEPLNPVYYAFVKLDDATLFKLKWGS